MFKKSIYLFISFILIPTLNAQVTNSGNSNSQAAEAGVRSEINSNPDRFEEAENAPAPINNENALGIGTPEDNSNFAGSQISEDDLTDNERILQDTFVHTGQEQRIVQEECNKSDENRAACAGREAEGKFLGVDSGMIKALSKAYSTIMGATGLSGGGGLKNKDITNTDGSTEKADDTNDYCKYIPIATEAIATFQQAKSQDTIQNSPGSQETNQKSALHKQARGHGERAKTAKIQTTGFGATTACYVALMIAKKSTLDFSSISLYLKVGAAGLLTAFYAEEVKNHEDYRDRVNAIAAKLPGPGDCNPISQRDCYCAQPETQFDPDFCLPNVLAARKPKKDSFATACVDDNLRTDPACTCVKTNSCFDQEFETKLSGLGGLNSGFAQSLFSDFGNLTRGQLTGGRITGSQSRATSAIGNILRQNANKVKLPDDNLNKSQREESKLIENLGVPKPFANQLALQPFDKKAKANVAKFKNSVSGKGAILNTRRKAKGPSVVTFKSGNSKSKSKKKSREFDFFSSLKKKKKGKSRAKGSEVVTFADRATNKALINNDRSRSIFEIMSRRYQSTGWKMLDGTN